MLVEYCVSQAVRNRQQEHRRRIRDGLERVVDLDSASESDMNDLSDGSDMDLSEDEELMQPRRK